MKKKKFMVMLTGILILIGVIVMITKWKGKEKEATEAKILTLYYNYGGGELVDILESSIK